MMRVNAPFAATLAVAAFMMKGGAFAASCAIPNQLTNGQIADATQVMADFNTLSNCFNTTLSPIGNPTIGSLLTFSSPTTVGSADLTGDVTTSGGVSTTLSPSGVNAGTYGDAAHVPQISVDAKGRITNAVSVPVAGAAGTGLFASTLSAVPTMSSTGLSNTLGANTSVADSVVGVYISGPNAGIGAYTTSVPNPPYTITVLLARNLLNGGILSLGWTDGTAIQFIYPNSSGSLIVQSNNSVSSYSGTNYSSSATGFPSSLLWLRISDDGTNVNFLSSQDGLHFATAYSVAKTAGFLGANGYSHIFVGAPGGPSGGMDVTVMSWKQS